MSEKKKTHQWKMTSLRITKELLDEIDKIISFSPSMSRNLWILGAIQEKINASKRK